MTTIEITLLFGLIACIIGIISFFGGRQTAAKKDGQEWGELKSDIKHIKGDIQEIKDSVGESNRDTSASIRRIHRRIDEHLRDCHNMPIPNYIDTEDYHG